MSDAARFLAGLGQALAAVHLYHVAHPARERANDLAYHRLQLLLQTDHAPRFSFVDREIVYGDRPLRELRDWAPAERLATIGVQRLEFSPNVSREDFERFIGEMEQRLTGLSTAGAAESRQTTVRYGALALRDEDGVTRLPAPLATATMRYSLIEEVAATEWIHAEVTEGRTIPLLEAEATVRSLASAMHAEQQMVMPLLTLREHDEYTTTHSLNVSVLAMALAEALGFAPREIRAFGVAGLLHDIGKVRIPTDVLNKPGRLTPAERTLIQQHPVEGARLILQSGQQLDVAAAVAYEHHIMIDGCGYPEMRFRRDCHPASHLVHLCDVYDALRTIRPYRAAWEHEKVMDYLNEKAGTEFDSTLVRHFEGMMREWRREVGFARDAAGSGGTPAHATTATGSPA
ncbi:MAG TPA: HD domain-containing phosphohydrolase [Gemmatimonadaceae bacterium]|nr:HD domain-containing phosphohydrolase [Gemmatimonadaceae bacterium]